MNLGPKIKYARQSINLSLNDVKQRTGIGESSLSEYENGKREPNLSQLAQLAMMYGRPLSFFLDEQAVVNQTVIWSEYPPNNSELIERKFLKLCEQYRNLEIWCDDIPSPRLPQIAGKADPLA